ncbi:GFA family protein [Alphaproteobacteria bacterium KMM 3653]|uniref:GFA family protein n=1 Tax=Harenicola maris TaxID=2841044 RepID=A0AAP2CSF7_9RHOB|nr:GFA family protein [Harenicola maris]
MATGGCLCGAVRFTVEAPLKDGDACHCSQCRRMSGHYWASTDVPAADLEVEGVEHVRWYQSSPKVMRGFCGTCGSTLFWNPIYRDWISISLGAFDGATGARLHSHIFVSGKGDYYDITDGLPQKD